MNHHHRLAMLASVILASGCAPVDEVTSATSALTGPAPQPPTNQGVVGPMGTNTWSSAADPNRWSNLVLADINGDGLDDLCGNYGDTWGCALRSATRTVFEGFVESRDVAVFYNESVRMADINGDGRADACGRYLGYQCVLSRGSSFSAPITYIADWSTANGWRASEYQSTVMIGRLEGNAGGLDICARGVAGVLCYVYVGAGLPMVALPAITAFSDGNGWRAPEYYSTLAMADVNGDGRMDVCGRGSAGVWCAVYDHLYRRFRPATLWTGSDAATRQFADADGWNSDRYYTSLRFGDVNGDAVSDVCGRGTDGVYCGISDGSGAFLGARNLVIPGMSDAAGFGSTYNRGTMTLVDYDQDGRRDVCMVGDYLAPTWSGTMLRHEIYCARSRSWILSFDAATRRTDLSSILDRVTSGRIRAGARGFCYVDAGGRDVQCTNAW